MFSFIWSIGATIGVDGRKKFDFLFREIMDGGLSEETRSKFHIIQFVDPPLKTKTVPIPKEGTLYDYRFVKEVRVVFY